MESPRPTSPLQTLPSRRPAWWREPKWWLTIFGGIALVGFGVLFTLLFMLRSLRSDVPRSAHAASGWVRLGKEVAAEGITPANQQHDGVTAPDMVGGMECQSLQRYPGRPELYAYFRIDPALRNQLTNGCIVEVEYFDGDAGGHFRLDYDSRDDSNRSLGAYTQSKERVNLRGMQRWRKARFLLDDPRFEGRQNDGADFRVTVVGSRFLLRSVKVVAE